MSVSPDPYLMLRVSLCSTFKAWIFWAPQ